MNDRNPAGAAIAYGNVRAALRLAGAEDEHGKTYNRDTALDVLLAYVPALLIELDRLAAALAAAQEREADAWDRCWAIAQEQSMLAFGAPMVPVANPYRAALTGEGSVDQPRP